MGMRVVKMQRQNKKYFPVFALRENAAFSGVFCNFGIHVARLERAISQQLGRHGKLR
jgi:hypothetical protein